MRKVLLALLFTVSVASATEWLTVDNVSGETVYLGYSEVGGNYGSCVLVAGQQVLIPRGTVFSYVANYPDFTWSTSGFVDQPQVYLEALGGIRGVGEWSVSMFGSGFGLGMTVAGAMLILHLVTLLKKPVLEG